VESVSDLVERWTPFVKEAARRFNIAEDWIMAVMRMESGGRTELAGKPITSKAGAMGIMQMMPDTYKDMRNQYGLGSDPYDPHDNVLAAAAYLKWLHGKYGYPKMFAAYNAGPGTLEAQMAGKGKLPAETQAYVKGIKRILGDGSNVLEASAAKMVEAPVSKVVKAHTKNVIEDSAENVVEARAGKSSRADTTNVAEASAEQPVRISVTYMPAEAVKSVATLTRPDGTFVTIDGATVDLIRASLPDEYAPGVQTVIAMDGKQQSVREDPATVALLLKHPATKTSKRSSPLFGRA
jgi:hypothetical protein